MPSPQGAARAATARPAASTWPGAFTITGAMLLLVYGVVRLEHPGDGWAGTVATFAAGLALLAVFVADRTAGGRPAGAAGHPALAAPWCAPTWRRCCSSAAFAGFQFLVTLYLQELRGWSTLQTGLAHAGDRRRHGSRAHPDPAAGEPVRQRPGALRRPGRWPAVAYVLFLPRRDGLDVRGDAADHAPARPGLLPGVRPADHGRHRRRSTSTSTGLAGGLLYTSFQFGTALGLSAVTAVNVAALGDGTTPEARLGRAPGRPGRPGRRRGPRRARSPPSASAAAPPAPPRSQ